MVVFVRRFECILGLVIVKLVRTIFVISAAARRRRFVNRRVSCRCVSEFKVVLMCY